MPPTRDVTGGRGRGTPDDPSAVDAAGAERGFGVHWLLTGLLVGGASWAVIGAIVAAVFGAWTLAGLLVLGAAALAATLVLLARGSARIRRASPSGRRQPGPRSVADPASDRRVA